MCHVLSHRISKSVLTPREDDISSFLHFKDIINICMYFFRIEVQLTKCHIIFRCTLIFFNILSILLFPELLVHMLLSSELLDRTTDLDSNLILSNSFR